MWPLNVLRTRHWVLLVTSFIFLLTYGRFISWGKVAQALEYLADQPAVRQRFATPIGRGEAIVTSFMFVLLTPARAGRRRGIVAFIGANRRRDPPDIHAHADLPDWVFLAFPTSASASGSGWRATGGSNPCGSSSASSPRPSSSPPSRLGPRNPPARIAVCHACAWASSSADALGSTRCRSRPRPPSSLRWRSSVTRSSPSASPEPGAGWSAATRCGRWRPRPASRFRRTTPTAP